MVHQRLSGCRSSHARRHGNASQCGKRRSEWFAQSLNAVTLAPIAGWTAARYFLLAVLGRASDQNSFGGRVVVTSNVIYFSGDTNTVLLTIKVETASGLCSLTWPIAGLQPAGVRYTPGVLVPQHLAQGTRMASMVRSRRPLWRSREVM